jgi:hypothetical protein
MVFREDIMLVELFSSVLTLRRGEGVFLSVSQEWDIHLDKKETTYFRDGVVVPVGEVDNQITCLEVAIRNCSQTAP